jgi:hypothetical protein
VARRSPPWVPLSSFPFPRAGGRDDDGRARSAERPDAAPSPPLAVLARREGRASSARRAFARWANLRIRSPPPSVALTASPWRPAGGDGERRGA